MRPVGGHGIGRSYSTQSDGSLICAFVTHHADTLHRQQDNACLPHLIVKAAITKTFYKYMVGLLKYRDFLTGHIAKYAHRKTGTGERMAAYQMLRHAERAPYGPDLIFEQEPERLAKLQIHSFRQAADIVVALYDSARN